MHVNTLIRFPGESWVAGPNSSSMDLENPQLILVFGERAVLEKQSVEELKEMFPGCLVVCCSTSGNIFGETVEDGCLNAAVLYFRDTTVISHCVEIEACRDSWAAGSQIANSLLRDDLCHILVLSDGQLVNGAQLVRGLKKSLKGKASVSGGLAGDGTLFQETLVGLNEAPTSGKIVGIGFCGSNLRVSCGSGGGWKPFGPERLVSRSSGNVLYELDGESSLEIYKRYLGEQAADLPASGLKFPLSLVSRDDESPVVRTILSIDETCQSLTFAGEIPEGAQVRLMRGFLADLIEGAFEAASNAKLAESRPDFAFCVSCVGRRLVFGQRVEEELEAIASELGDVPLFGFYSYGEIGSVKTGGECLLHNQSITLTTFKELGPEHA